MSTTNGYGCAMSYNDNCNEGCAKQMCEAGNGVWLPRDYNSNPYTCEMAMPQGIKMCSKENFLYQHNVSVNS